MGGWGVAEDREEELNEGLVGGVICGPDYVDDLGHVGLRFGLFEGVFWGHVEVEVGDKIEPLAVGG